MSDVQPLEPLETLNQRLQEHFGKFEDGRPNWRITWSTNETEYRMVHYTKEGFELINPQKMLVKKYPLDQDRYILEHLIPVPDGIDDLTTKTSYEPLWTFEDANRNPLPPLWEICYLLINQVQINMLAAGHQPIEKAPYGFGNTAEECSFRAKKLMDELFGNETEIGDALTYGHGVGYGVSKRELN